MALVQYDPENEVRPDRSFGRVDMRSRALRSKHYRGIDKLNRISSSERIEAENLARAKRLDKLAEAAKARFPETQVKRAFISTGRMSVIIHRALKVFKVSKTELLGAARNSRIVLARQFVMYWARRLIGLSMPQIGRRLGGRDHTTVLHGAKAYVNKRAAMKRYLRPAR